MPLETEINAYEQMRGELERRYDGKFVVFHGREFVGAFDDLEAAAKKAVELFGRGPYLIRLVGVNPDYIPVAVFHSANR